MIHHTIMPEELEVIEPLLRKYFGYSEALLLGEIQEAYDRIISIPALQWKRSYIKSHQIPLNELSKALDQECPYQPSYSLLNTVDIFANIKERKENIYLNYKDKYDFEEFKKKFPLECDDSEKIERIHTALFLIVYLISGREISSSLAYSTEAWEGSEDDILLYNNHVRPDMLKLFLFIQDIKSQREKRKKEYQEKKADGKSPTLSNISSKIKIHCEGVKVEIENEGDDWFLWHLEGYLHEYLAVKDIKQAKAELKSYNNKAGLKFLDEKASRVIYGTCKLLQEELYHHNKVTNDLCCFVNNLLEYMNLPSLITKDVEDFNYSRSRIAYLLKEGNYTPTSDLWNVPEIDKRPDKIKNNILPF